MYAILSIDNDGQVTKHASARPYAVALALADDLLSKHATVTIAHMHSTYYVPLVTLTHERNAAPIPHDRTPDNL